MPQVQSRGELPLWMKALAQAMPSKPAWQAALETAPTPGMIEFPLAAKQFAEPTLTAFMQHVMKLAGMRGGEAGGSSLATLPKVGGGLKSLKPFTELKDWQKPFHARAYPDIAGTAIEGTSEDATRLAQRLSPSMGMSGEADTEAGALLKLLFNPVFYNKFYRGPFPK